MRLIFCGICGYHIRRDKKNLALLRIDADVR